MGRPKNPFLYAISVLLFPAVSGKPWEGQPIQTQPSLDYLTPGDTLAAEEYNYLLGQMTGNQSKLTDLVGQLSANNWPVNSVAPPSGTDFTSATWDPKNARWIAGASSGTSTYYESRDGGVTWVGLAPSGQPSAQRSVAVKATDGTILALQSDSNTAHLTGTAYTFSTNWATHAGSAPSGAGKCATWFNAAGLFVVISTVNTTPFPAIVATSPDGVTWTDRTTGAAFTNGFGGTTTPTLGWTAQSSTTLLAFSPVASFATYYSTTDGAAWTSHTSPVTTGESVVAASYDSENAVFVILVNDGTTSRCLTSSDGVNWTANAMPSTVIAGNVFSGLAASGSLYVATVKNNGAAARACYSTDKGSTWRWCLGFSLAAPTVTTTPARVYSNGNQFLAWNNSFLNLSLIDGQSPIAV